MNQARARLTILWVAFFLLDLAIGLYLYLDGWIGIENFKALLTELNTSYAPYVGAILAFYWAGKQAAKTEGVTRQQKIAFILAFVCALMWNLFLSVLLLRLVLRSGKIEDTVELMAFLRGIFTWLVAGSTGFFFGAGK